MMILSFKNHERQMKKSFCLHLNSKLLLPSIANIYYILFRLQKYYFTILTHLDL